MFNIPCQLCGAAIADFERHQAFHDGLAHSFAVTIAVADLIGERTGIQITDKDLDRATEKVEQAMRAGAEMRQEIDRLTGDPQTEKPDPVAEQVLRFLGHLDDPQQRPEQRE